LTTSHTIASGTFSGWYSFYVVATGSCDSGASQIITKEFTSGNVVAPQLSASSTCGSSSITLSWYPSANQFVTGYEIQMRNSQVDAWKTLTLISSRDARSFEVR
jgi:hypothetical protein